MSSLAGASGFTGDTGATGQTGVTGGWTLLPSHEAASSVMPHECAITTSHWYLAFNAPLLAGASGFTGDIGATGQTGVTGEGALPSSHEAESRPMPWRCVIVQVMGSSLSMRRCLQAPAASQATWEPLVRRVSRVSGHTCHELSNM